MSSTKWIYLAVTITGIGMHFVCGACWVGNPGDDVTYWFYWSYSRPASRIPLVDWFYCAGINFSVDNIFCLWLVCVFFSGALGGIDIPASIRLTFLCNHTKNETLIFVPLNIGPASDVNPPKIIDSRTWNFRQVGMAGGKGKPKH